MGRFSTTTQIKNNIDRAGFISAFNSVMAKRGFVPCVEDEAAKSYLLAFSDGWVTLASEEYRDDPRKAYDDSKGIAAALKTSAFTVEVVDSDFGILNLFTADGGEDEVIVGDGSGYGIEEPARGNCKYWEPLIAKGKTWEQFSKVVEQENTFVEETLGNLAAVFGIDPYYIDADFDEIMEKADGVDVTAFYFKKAADKKSKPMTLNAAFVKVFGEALEPLGFKKIKSKYPYFVRVVPGGEIIHVVSVAKNKQHGKISPKEFNILCGVATIYRAEINFNQSPENSWLQDISHIYTKFHIYDWDMEYNMSISDFKYDTPIPHILQNYDVKFTTNESEMFDSLQKSLDATLQTALPVLNEVTDLMSCEKYFNTVTQSTYPNLNFAKDVGEGLFLMKLFSSAEELYEFTESEALCELKHREYICNKAGADFSSSLQMFEDSKEVRKKSWFDTFNDPELWQVKAPAELERRKKANTEVLKEVGLNL